MDQDEPCGPGRPSTFTQEIADAICDRLADARSLRSICLDADMPAQSTVFRWLAAHQSFREQYARAREAQADAMADEILDIADDGTNDWMQRQREDGSTEEMLNHEHIQRSKLRVDSRKWLAAKLQPKKYGDASLLKLGDSDGNNLDFAAMMERGLKRAENGRDC